MTLDFDLDSKPMDNKTADLLETADEIYNLVISHSPDIEDPNDGTELDIKFTEAFTKAPSILQIVTGICGEEASQALEHVIDRAIKKDQCIEQLERQLKEKGENG